MPVDPSRLGVYFLDVGQGDCTIVVPPAGEGDPILFDCADSYAAERFVANHGITHLRAVVASHLDVDHVRGLLPFLQTHFAAGRRVDRLVLFADRVAAKGKNDTLREMVAAALDWERRLPHPGFVLKASHRDGEGPLLLAEGPDWRVELVLPWVGAASQAIVSGGHDPNGNSAVLRVIRGGTAILIGGDAPLGSWERLEPDLQRAGVIRVPHHGGEIRDGGSTWTRFEDLYNAVGADLSVISVGTNNGHGHPLDAHAAAAHRAHTCRLLCTQLTPRCHDDPASVRTEALLQAGGVEWPYRHLVRPGHPHSRPPAEVPCAGTVAAWIDASGNLEVEPAPGADHDRLLRRVDHPLCRP